MVSVREIKEEKARRAIEKRGAAAAIPQALIPTELEGAPRSIEELTGGLVTRPLAEGLGGILGAAATSPSLATPAGPLAVTAGGTLGAVGGGLLFTNAEDFLAGMGILDRPQSTLEDLGEQALETATIDVAAAGVGSLVRPILGTRALLGKLFGVNTQQAQRLAKSAETVGVNLGAADVGGTVPKTIVKALGVFPLTGTPARTNLLAKESQISQRMLTLLDDLSPNATLINELGEDLSKSARLRIGAFNRLSARLASNFDSLASNASVKEIVPTEQTRQLAQDLAQEVVEGRVTLTSGKALPEAIESQAAEFINLLQELPENVTIKQYRGLVKSMRNLMDVVQKQGGDFANATKIKQALEIDLNNIRADLLPEGEARQLVDALTSFNRTYSKGIAGFQTTTAGKFARIDRNIFKPGPVRPASLSDDEIARVAINTKSSKAIDELEFLVGKGKIKDAARNHVENAFKLASESREFPDGILEVLDPARLKAELGLRAGRRGQSEGLKALLKKGNVDIGDLETLLDAAISLEKSGDPSTFVKRRVILGGAGAITGAVGAGAALGGAAGAAAGGGASLPLIAAGTLLARKFTDIATNPVALKNMVTALDTARKTTARQQALARVVVALGRDAQVKRKENTNRGQPSAPRQSASAGQAR